MVYDRKQYNEGRDNGGRTLKIGCLTQRQFQKAQVWMDNLNENERMSILYNMILLSGE
jgi:hypothetical protein